MGAMPTVTMSNTTGAVPTLTALTEASNTHQMPSSDGQAFAVYRNTNAAARTLTVTGTGTTTYGVTKPNMLGGASNLAATTGELWVPLYKEMADANGNITITVSNFTNVTSASVRIA